MAGGRDSSSATTCCRVALRQGRPRLYPAAMIGGDALPPFLGFRAILWPGPTWHASPPVCALEPASCIRQYRFEFAGAVIRRTAHGGCGESDQPAIVGGLCICDRVTTTPSPLVPRGMMMACIKISSLPWIYLPQLPLMSPLPGGKTRRLGNRCLNAALLLRPANVQPPKPPVLGRTLLRA
jgi:hypothetical protein